VKPTRVAVWCLLATLLPGAAAAAFPRPEPASKDGLQQQLETWFRKASRVAPGTWGIAVATQEGQLLWAVQPTLAMIPASTVKVFTTGFARSILGADARRTTRVLGTGHLDPFDGTWVGAWSLELNGDPTLERPLHGGPTFVELAQQLSSYGIRRLTGPLALESAAGDVNAVFPPVWENRQQGRYFAPLIGNIMLNEGLVTFAIAPGPAVGKRPVLRSETPLGVSALVTIQARTVAGSRSRLTVRRGKDGEYVVSGTIGARARTKWFTFTAHDPKAVAEAVWARALDQTGIRWDREQIARPAFPLSTGAVLAKVHSVPFDSIAMEVNRRSVNIAAELLLRWAGGPTRAAERLTEHVREVTGELSGLRLVDGSGLSRLDRVSPLTFISYLARFPALPAGRGFPMLLPTNGMGTLRKLSGMPGPGIVRAKTGTLADAATVVGYLGRPEGVLLISLMYNGPRVYDARQEQWKLFRLLGAEGVLLPDDSSSVGVQLGGSAPVDTIPPQRP